MDREGVIQKFQKKQKHIKKSKKIGRKKIEEIRNIGKNAVEAMKSIFISLGSRCGSASSKPSTISKASLAFANRYRHLKDRTTV